MALTPSPPWKLPGDTDGASGFAAAGPAYLLRADTLSLPDLHSSIRVCGNIPVQEIAASTTVTGESHPVAEKQYIHLRDCYNAYLVVSVGSVASPVQVKLQSCDDVSVARPTWTDVSGATDVILATEDNSIHIYQINLRGREDGPYYRASLYVGGGPSASTLGATFLAAWPKDNLLGGDLSMTAIDATW